MSLPSVSARQSIVETIGLSQGKKILIHGGAGGIGSIAIQMAKRLGSYTVRTVSTNDKELAKEEIGADEVIECKTQTFEDALSHDYDEVFDTAGGETYTRSFKVLKTDGSGANDSIFASMLVQPNQELWNQFGVRAVYQFTKVNRESLTRLAEWTDQNNIRVNVEKTWPLDEARTALDYQRDVHSRVRSYW